MAEKIQIDYLQQTTYLIEDSNIVGANTSLTLRTVTVHGNANTKYVRKFGKEMSETGVTTCDAPPANLTMKIYALDDTLLGSRANGGAYVDGGTVSAQGIYIEFEASGGAGVLAGTESITFTDFGAMTVNFPAETVADGDTLRLYLSETTSTYYDEAMKYGGERHTPDGTEELPYFTITTAGAALGGAHTIITVLDSGHYNESVNISGAYTLQAESGETPTLDNLIGSNIYTEVSTQYNNLTAVYFNASGNDSTGDGTFQNPFETTTAAIAGRGAKAVVFGGQGATTGEIITYTTALDNNCTIETDYGYVLNFENSLSASGNVGVTQNMRGLLFRNNAYITLHWNATTFNIDFCTFENIAYKTAIDTFTQFAATSTLTVDDCIFNNVQAAFLFDPAGTDTFQMLFNAHRNKIYNSNNGFSLDGNTGAANTWLAVLDISNNTFSNIDSNGLYFYGDLPITLQGVIDNNSFVNCDYGIRHRAGAGASTATFDENIFTGCTIGIDAADNFTIDYNCFYNNGTDTVGAGVITSNNEINGDPKIIDIANNRIGIDVDSSCYKADGSENDVGANLTGITISSINVKINGITFNGNFFYNNAIQKTGAADYTGLLIKWCTIEDYNGISIDDYSGVDTDSVINNNHIENNGSGTMYMRGGNTDSYNLIKSNVSKGIYFNEGFNTINHNSIVSNYYGVYIGAATNIIYKNTISYANSLYGIYSDISTNPLYCCINDAVNDDKVSILESNNSITDDPLFIDVTDSPGGFHLKSKARGSLYNSPCLEGADDSEDMGIYLESRGVSDYSWKKLVLDYNPRKLNELLKLTKPKVNRDSLGNPYPIADNDSIILPFEWAEKQITTKEDYEAIRFLQTRYMSRTNTLKRSDIIDRIWLLPDSNIISGTGTIDTAAETLTDSGGAYGRDRYKNFWLGIKFEELTGVTVTASTKTILKTGAGWTPDEHQNYFVKYNGYTLLVLSNNTDTLFLSDPDGVLSDGAFTGHIEYYFRVTGMTPKVFSLDDKDSKLKVTNYGYYIGFLRMVVISNKFAGIQPRYIFDRDELKTGYKINFERVTD